MRFFHGDGSSQTSAEELDSWNGNGSKKMKRKNFIVSKKIPKSCI